jgi:DNA-binding transcriptional ArsR family regulator
MSVEEVDRLFQALADATRRDILLRTINQEQSVSSLAAHYDMSFAAVQKHVAVLERAALVTKERRGREQIVHSHEPTLTKATRILDS